MRVDDMFSILHRHHLAVYDPDGINASTCLQVLNSPLATWFATKAEDIPRFTCGNGCNPLDMRFTVERIPIPKLTVRRAAAPWSIW